VKSRDGCPPQQAAAGCHLQDVVPTCQQCRHLITQAFPQMTPDRKLILPILWIARKPRCALSWTTIFAGIPRHDGRCRRRAPFNPERSLPNTCEDDFDRPILLLWPKGSLIIGVENEGAPRIDGKRIEDALVVLACDYTGLATFSLDETNGGAEPRRSSRAWWPFRSRRSLIAPFTFLGYRVLDEFVASVVGVRV